MKNIKQFIFIISISISIVNFIIFSHNAKAFVQSNETMPWISLLLSIDTTTVTISGKATIPNYTPAGSLMLLVDCYEDKRICGGGISDTNGNYTINASVPKDTKYVLVYAVDPNNPEYYVKAYININDINVSKGSFNTFDSEINSKKQEPISNGDILRDLNARSLAESLVREYSYRQPGDFSQKEWDAVATIESAIREGTYKCKLCSTEQNEQIDTLLVSLSESQDIPEIEQKIDSFVRQPGELINRVRNAQAFFTNSITSSNYKQERGVPAATGLAALAAYAAGIIPGPVGWGFAGVSAVQIAYNEFRVTITRNMLDSLYLPSLVGQPSGQVLRRDLEEAAIIIYYLGYGNCLEKGIAGAYIASRFNEFKQVAHVVIETDNYSLGNSFADHSFAIACTEDESVYNISDLINAEKWVNWITPPQEFYSAGCYLIDPWAGKTELLTPSIVANERWHKVSHVMKLYMRSMKRNDTIKLYQEGSVIDKILVPKISKSCSINSSCNTCPTKEELTSRVCTPFTLPVSGNEKKYYLFKRSGSGYRGMWGGWSDRLTGYDYFYQYILPSEAETVKENFSKFSESRDGACQNTPSVCPCPPYPAIWASGKIEIVGIFDTLEELDPYRCNNHHRGPSYLICNMWNEESAPHPGFWPAIQDLCSDTAPGNSSGEGQVYDCAATSVSESTASSRIGNGICDDGTYGYDLRCETFYNDEGDCDRGGSPTNPTDPGQPCGDGMIYDCVETCINEATALNWIGDGSCDDGTYGMDLRCEIFDNDAGDCDTPITFTSVQIAQ